MSLIIDALEFYDEFPPITEELTKRFWEHRNNAYNNAVTPERREIAAKFPDQGLTHDYAVTDIPPFCARLLITFKENEWRYVLCITMNDARQRTTHPSQEVLTKFAGLFGLMYSEIEGDDFFAQAVFEETPKGTKLSILRGPVNAFWKAKYNLT